MPPALAAADVGFAMSTGTDIAIESADISLMKNDMRSVASAIDLSKATFRKILKIYFLLLFTISWEYLWLLLGSSTLLLLEERWH